jgi:hypothetical protein
MVRGNPHPHRYKYGKVEKAISLDVLKQLMERVANNYARDFLSKRSVSR